MDHAFRADHAAEVASLWDDFAERKNDRVPITFAIEDQVWLKVAGRSFREFYTDPRVHIEAQLVGMKWFCDNLVCDVDPSYPDKWSVDTHYWMEENEFFGCSTTLQEDDYAWAQPLELDRQDLLSHVESIDPEAAVRGSHAFRLYESMRDLAAGMSFEDRPVEVRFRFGTDGVFTKAAEVRGLESLCEDLIDAPDFVDAYLGLVTEKTIERMRAWHLLATGTEAELPSKGGFGCCDDSLQMISAEAYDRFVLPWHERLYAAMADGPRGIHLCGRSTQHYPSLRRKLGVTNVDGPGPFVDHGRYLAEFGPEFSFSAQVDHATLMHGTAEQIEAMYRNELTPGAKQPGRFTLMGLLSRDTPLENLDVAYRVGKEAGRIS